VSMIALGKHPTSNIHPTLNIQVPTSPQRGDYRIGCWMLSVGCWMFSFLKRQLPRVTGGVDALF
jgi:hypothetical protein